MFKIKFNKDILSHEVSRLADYHFGQRQSNTVLEDTIEDFTDNIYDMEGVVPGWSSHHEDHYDKSKQTSKQFAQEVFGTIYEKSEAIKDNKWAKVQSTLDDLPEVQQLKRTCFQDADMSAIATSHIIDAFADTITETLQYIDQQQKEQDQQSNGDQGSGGGQDGNESCEGNGDGNGDGNSPDGKSDPGNDDPNKGVPDIPIKLLRKFSKDSAGMKDVVDQLKEAGNAMRSIGLSGDESDAVSDYDRSKLFKDIYHNPTFRKLLSFVGRMQSLMSSLPAVEVGRVGTNTNSYRVNQSLNPKDLHKREVRTLGVSKKLFALKYVQKSQLIKKKRLTKPAGEGGVILLTDCSGSMHGAYNDLAVAFGAAVASVCRKKDRSFYGIDFNHILLRAVKSIGKSYQAYRGHGSKTETQSFVDILNYMLTRGCGGGTNFDAPLEEAINCGVDKADILLLTDGYANVSDDIIQKLVNAKKKSGLRVFTILVGGAQTNAVAQISDGVFNVTDLNDDHTMSSLAKAMNMAFRRKAV